MRKVSLLIACLGVFLFIASPANALIETWNCAADGDGAIETAGDLDGSNWTDNGLEGGINSYTLAFDATQAWGPAHMEGDFTTDTETDPIVYIIEDVDNATGFTWTGYEFKVYMTKTFDITTAFAPENWGYTIGDISGLVSFPHETGVGYMRTVLFTADPGYGIADGDIGTFGVKLKFDGSVAFCTEQTPIPEPATMALLGFGGLALLRRKK